MSGDVDAASDVLPFQRRPDHLAVELLAGFAQNRLSRTAMARAEAHLRRCSTCQRKFAELTAAGDAPSRLAAASAAAAATRAARRDALIIGTLTAALLIGLLGDVYFALAMQRSRQLGATVAAIGPPGSAPAHVSRPSQPRTAKPIAHRVAVVRPAAMPVTPETRAHDPTITTLRARLTAAQTISDAEAIRIAQLARRLADVRAQRTRVAPVVGRPHRIRPSGSAGVPTRTRISAAAVLPSPPTLRAGEPANPDPTPPTRDVYTVEGEVDNEPWPLTIIQPRDGSHAFLFSRTPDAPAGETYRIWVIRGANVFDIGGLPHEGPAMVPFPIALEHGDLVAFSREPVGTGTLPTQPFLRSLKIPH